MQIVRTSHNTCWIKVGSRIWQAVFGRGTIILDRWSSDEAFEQLRQNFPSLSHTTNTSFTLDDVDWAKFILMME